MACDRKKYLLETVLPESARLGRFGKGLKFLRCVNSDGKTGDQFASAVVFINAIFGSDSEPDKERTFKVVLKFLPENIMMREVMNSTVQFHNEIAMYSDIIPKIDYNNITPTLFPEFYYGNNVNEENQESIVVIEDLSNKNFGLAKLRLFLDYDHVIVALKALGKFHALSYITKQKKPNEFNEIKDKLVEHVWNRTDGLLSAGSIIGPSALRGVKALSEIQSNETLEKLLEILPSGSVDLMKKFVLPDEPTSVICHGDFCNHNLLFSYDDASSKPTSVRLIDLQTSRYASPVIDLSMLLFLNTEYELRSRYWDEFISSYHESVTQTVTAAGCVPPSFDQLLNELKHKCFYGYFHCSYFLPMMVNQEQPNIDDTINENPQELMEQIIQMGGDKGTHLLVNILKHLQELDFFAFLS